LIQILPLSTGLYFQPWLTTDQVRLKCAEEIKNFISQNLISERQLINILPLSIDLYFSHCMAMNIDEDTLSQSIEGGDVYGGDVRLHRGAGT
jgi:hypothetical protein